MNNDSFITNETQEIIPEYDNNKNVTSNLEILLSGAENSGLDDSFFNKYKDYLNRISQHLNLTPEEVIILCPFINEPDKPLPFSRLAKYYHCSFIHMMQYEKHLRSLCKKHYLRKINRYDTITYNLSSEAFDAICQGRAIIDNKEQLSPMKFMKEINKLIKMKSLDKIETSDFIEEINYLLELNQHLEIVKAIDVLPINSTEKIIVLFFCKTLILDNERYISKDDLECIIDDESDIFHFEICDESHILAKDGLITTEVQENILGSQNDLILTDKAIKLLLKEYDFKLKFNSTDIKGIIKNNSIIAKTLSFNQENQESIDRLKNLLDETKLATIRTQLSSKGWCTGFTCLFYGTPGTGKTETVMQLARETGRDIMQVDISSIRTKWYGETERKIKKIFSDYKEYANQSNTTPILLFNEADAILSVRTSINENTTAISKTENTVQNILLQEIENFNGILIATTNITNNFDSAFERRFLYKINFERPDINTKREIWQNLLPQLTHEEALQLASKYEFSGSEISNIARKCFIDEILFEKSINIEYVIEVCSQEKITERKKIGF